MKDLDIAAVAKRSGVPASTLRFYEEKGLIASVGRVGLRRLFDPTVLERLALIALARASGFTLAEIGRLFGPPDQYPGGRMTIDRAMLVAKATELDRTIRQLTTMRDGLRHAAVCKAPSHRECPKFQRFLKAAMAGMIRAPESATSPSAARRARKGAAARPAARGRA